MSLSRDALLFSIVLMLFALRIEIRGYGGSGWVVAVALGIAVVGLLGSARSTLRAADRSAETDDVATDAGDRGA